MRQWLPHLLYSLVFSVVLFGIASEGLVRRFNYDALLYEAPSPDSPYVQFSRSNRTEWKNLTKLTMSKTMEQHTLVCTRGPGSWIMYPEADFMVGESTHITLVVGEHCVVTEGVMSMQPIGMIREPFMEGLILFPKPYFQMEQKIITSLNKTFSGDIGSFIYAGDGPWQIGTNVCLLPAYSEHGTGVCLIPNVDSAMKLSGSKAFKPGCDGDKLRIFAPQTCYAEGVYKIPVQSDFTAKGLAGICGGGAGGGDAAAGGGAEAKDAKGGEKKAFMKEKFSNIMEIWKARMVGGIEGTEMIKIPFEAQHMTQLLFKVVDIFHDTCPSVQPGYLGVLKNIFVLHLRSAWERMPDMILSPEDQYWQHAAMFMDSCHSHMGGIGSAGHVGQDGNLFCSPNVPPPDDEDPEALVFYDMLLDHGFDAVIEQMWYIFNAVTPTCNTLNQYKTNDWLIFGNLLKRAFFDPISIQWEAPGPWKRVYTTMFHGYNMNHQRMKILACVQHSLALAPHLDPIARTEYFTKKEKKMMRDKFMALVGNKGNKTEGAKPPEGGGEATEAPETGTGEGGGEGVEEATEAPAGEEGGGEAATEATGEEPAPEEPAPEEGAEQKGRSIKKQGRRGKTGRK